MPIIVNCPACGMPCTIAEEYLGQSLACPTCSYVLDDALAELYETQRPRRRIAAALSNPVWFAVACGGAIAAASIVLIAISSLFRSSRQQDAAPLPPVALAPPGGAAQPLASNPLSPGSAVRPPVQPVVQPLDAGAPGAANAPGGGGRRPYKSNASNSTAPPKMKAWKAAPGGRLGMAPKQDAAPELPAEWQSAVDPPRKPIVFDGKRKYRIAFPGEAQNTKLVRPDVASPFVALRSGRDVNQDWDLWNLVEAKRISSVKQVMMGDAKHALSPDGRYLASTDTFKTLIYIWDLIAKESVGIIELEEGFPGDRTIVFPSAKRLLCVGDVRGSSKSQLTIWKMPEGTPERTQELADAIDKESPAISPGGKYLAMITRGSPITLQVYEVDSGNMRGEAVLPHADRGFSNVKGLAFSPDGKELAAYCEDSGNLRLLCWNMESGELTDNIELKKSLREGMHDGNSYEGRPIDWFPDGKRWLVDGQVVVDRTAEGAFYRLPTETGMHNAEQRIVLDDEKLLVGMGGWGKRALMTYEIEQEQLARGIENSQRGGKEIDQQLPPLTPADISAAVEVSGVADEWQVKPDPAPAPAGKFASRPIDLKDGSGTIFFSRADVGKVLLDCSASLPFNFRNRGIHLNQQRAHRLCLYDLFKGKHLKSVPLAYDADAVAFSPDGNRVAVRLTEGRDRIDVFDIQTEKHLAGWRPYPEEKEQEDRFAISFGNREQQVEEAEFVDAEHLLTKGRGDLLVLWTLPECRAVWTARSRHFKLSPNHKYLALVNDNTVTLIDALSGEPQGQLDARGAVSALAIDATGTRLATLASRSANSVLQTWNLADGKQVESFLLARWAAKMQWCGEEHVLLDQQYLVSLARGMVLWKYEGSGGAQTDQSPDGRVWYTAFRGGVGGLNYSLNALALPDPLISLRLRSLAPSRELAVGPGKSISLKLNLPTVPDRPKFAEEVRQALVGKFNTHQVTVVDGQAVVLELSYASGPTGETLVSHKGGFGIFAQPDKDAIRLPEMKVECRAAITLNSKLLWERKSYSTTPTGHFRLAQGETLEAHVNKSLWQSAGAFFEHLEVPGEVLASGMDEGYGVSTLIRGGAVPKEEQRDGPMAR